MRAYEAPMSDFNAETITMVEAAGVDAALPAEHKIKVKQMVTLSIN